MLAIEARRDRDDRPCIDLDDGFEQGSTMLSLRRRPQRLLGADLAFDSRPQPIDRSDLIRRGIVLHSHDYRRSRNAPCGNPYADRRIAVDPRARDY